jgi:outer membrane protein assembly factor BamB
MNRNQAMTGRHLLRVILLILLAVCVNSSTARLQAGEWPQFRGPQGLGIADVKASPTELSLEKNLDWKTPVPPGFSSPVLTEDRIFLTGYEGEKGDEALLTICLNRADGKVLWRRQAPRPRKEPYNPIHGPTSTSPVTDGENVYAFFGDFGLLSYDGAGNERWRVPLGPFANRNGHGSSPIVVGDKVILICDQDTESYILALNKDDGSVRWKVDRPGITRGYATPAILRPPKGPAEVIAPGAYRLVAHSLETGEALWWVGKMPWQVRGVPVIDGGTIYFNAWESGGGTSSEEIPPFDEVLTKFDANHDGKISPEEHPNPRLRQLGPNWEDFDLNDDGFFDSRDWLFYRGRLTSESSMIAIRPDGARGDLTDTKVMWRYYKSLPNSASALLYEGVVYLVKDGGILTTLDPKTGDVLKQGRLNDALEKYWASPIAADGRIYVTSEACKVSVLKPGGQWEIAVINDLPGDCYATPAIVDGHFYLRTSEAMYSFSAAK